MVQRLNYLPVPRKRSLWPAIIDSMAIVVALAFVNAVMLLLTFCASEIDRGAYVIFYGPANAAVAVIALASTPLVKRLSPDLSGKMHVGISLLLPAVVIVALAVLFMS